VQDVVQLPERAGVEEIKKVNQIKKVEKIFRPAESNQDFMTALN
jgi:hypothetical protein